MKYTAYLHGSCIRSDGKHDSHWTLSVPVKESLLPFRRLPASGYGSRIPMEYMVKFNGRWRRVYCRIYCRIYPNSGSLYIRSAPDELISVDIQREESK